MKLKLIIIILILFGVTSMVVMASENSEKGAPNITLDGGKKGNIDFPHHMHQDNIRDCNVCHDLFPQQPGVIQYLKNQGKLEKKQVMNKKCLECHRAKKKAGKKTGPTKCSECHIK